MAPIRVRQHVNPLSQKYQTPIAPLDWEKIFINPTQPLHLDIGCGKGRFLLQMATLAANWNFLGLEIREPLVTEANKLRAQLRITNLHYLFGNVNNSLESLLSNLPAGVLQRVSIQFPDPWFKNRHAKRRVVQPELVAELAQYLASGGIVFLQSDIEAIALEMCDRFTDHPLFHRQDPQWMSGNPLPVPTERETSTLSRGLPVYRAVFVRK